MRRRRFLQLVALGAGSLPLADSGHGRQSPQRLMTVLGPVPVHRLGQTLMHEHILADFIGADQMTPGRYDPEEVFQKALPFLTKLKAVGGDALVECTPEHIGRDVKLFRRLSQASGVRIITSTGIYGAMNDKFVPRYAYAETAEQLALRWAREFEDGIPPGGVRPGIIKIGVDGTPLSEVDAKLAKAAAQAHRRTGMVIASHTGPGAGALAQLEVLKAAGVEPAAFIWVHAQAEADTSLHRCVAELGAWVEFDGIAPATVAKHVELVLAMKRAGLLHRVLISHDAGWFHVGSPGGGEFRGYDTLFTAFIPALRQAGASPGDVHTLLVDNPRQALVLRPQSEVG